MNKEEQMADLQAEGRALVAELYGLGKNMVWGEGNLDAVLMLVGEASGRQEDITGKPFVGPAGLWLNNELAKAGISRTDIYITSVVKHRPTKEKNGRLSNRKPTAGEIAEWRNLILRQIEVISPKVVLCLGIVAASTLIHPKFSMVKDRGKWFEGPQGIKIMGTYHPAYMRRFAHFADSSHVPSFQHDLNMAKREAGL